MCVSVVDLLERANIKMYTPNLSHINPFISGIVIAKHILFTDYIEERVQAFIPFR